MRVLFDLDGTIANIDHRTHFVRGDSALAAVRERVAANTNSQTQVDACRALHGAKWAA